MRVTIIITCNRCSHRVEVLKHYQKYHCGGPTVRDYEKKSVCSKCRSRDYSIKVW